MKWHKLIKISIKVTLIGSSLQSRTGLNFGRIWLVILELPALQRWKKWCRQLFSVTFDWVFVKLAGNEDRHKSSNKFEFGSGRIIHFGVICPWAPIFNPRGYIHVLNHGHNCIKSDLKRFLWNLQQVGKVIRPFCWHQTFVPAPELYTCIKSWKQSYKIRLQRDFFETCNKWEKW